MSDDTPPATPDLLTLKRTFRWLWRRKQLYQFMHHAIRKKRLALEIEEADALRQATLFQNRMDSERRRYPALFGNTDTEGEEWKA